jgi:NAD dependent epimerase/dehydratase family enzyme
MAGPVNPVSPNPMRSADFATAASQALGQKSGGSMHAFLVRLLFGEMGEEFLLSSRRIQPAKLLAAGYQFRFPELEQALRHELGRLNANSDSEPTLPVKELQP